PRSWPGRGLDALPAAGRVRAFGALGAGAASLREQDGDWSRLMRTSVTQSFLPSPPGRGVGGEGECSLATPSPSPGGRGGTRRSRSVVGFTAPDARYAAGGQTGKS